MDYIRKIPLLLGLGTALLIGVVGFMSGIPNKSTILSMTIGMGVFYTVGIFIRDTIKSIIEQTLIKIIKKQDEEKKRELERIQMEKQKGREQAQSGKKLDLVADDSLGPDLTEEDFDALPIAEFIKKELR